LDIIKPTDADLYSALTKLKLSRASSFQTNQEPNFYGCFQVQVQRLLLGIFSAAPLQHFCETFPAGDE